MSFNTDAVLMMLLAIPFLFLVAIAILIVVVYLIYLIIEILLFNSRKQVKEMFNLMKINETVDIPDYEPAVMGYLVNVQKIGRREICSTLFDLVARRKIKIELLYGTVSGDVGKYRLTLRNKENLKDFEIGLIDYLFSDSNEITQKDLSDKLYKKNLNKNFYEEFLRGIQKEAKSKDFFSKKYGKLKVKIYKIINTVVTFLASVTSFMVTIVGAIIDDSDFGEISLIIFVFSLICAAVLWILKFIVSFTYNLTCYYNEFSKRGNEDYRKWKGFKRYLKRYSEIPNHPIMGVLIWEKYYAYAIGLKVSKKFYKQMKKMKIADNSINIELFSMFNEIIECIGLSTKRMKSISLDKYGGSHVDY